MRNSTKLLSALLVGATVLMSGCNRAQHPSDLINPLEERDGSFYINGVINPLRMAGDAWTGGDAIGVFALQKGTNTLHGTFVNLKYTTPDANGKFMAANGGVVLSGSETADIVAYYPHNSAVGAEMIYPINVANQDDLSQIDLLRGKTPNVTKETKEAQMTFDHRLALLNLTVNGSNLTNVAASVDGLKTDGTYNIATDEVLLGSTTAKLSANLKNGKIQIIAIPGQSVASISFNINGKEVTHRFDTPVALQKGYKYSLTFEMQEPKGEEIKLISSNINPWTEGITDGGVITLPLDDTDNNSGDNGDSSGDNSGDNSGDDSGDDTPPTSSATNLLFQGADFEDWSAFTASLQDSGTYGFKKEFVTSSDEGRSGKAIKLSGSRDGNDVIFSVKKTSANIDGKSISRVSFYVKGTSTAKSIVVQLYDDAGNTKAFNVKDIDTQEVVVKPEERNSYTGKIDTQGQWTKIVLDTSTFKMGADKYDGIFAFRVGSKSDFNLLIDDITFE